jgi:hypothetical protein
LDRSSILPAGALADIGKTEAWPLSTSGRGASSND